MISKRIHTAVRTIAAATVAGLLATSPAHAGNACRNVQLYFTNDTGANVNIVDIDYWDPAKGRNGGWRSEPVINETVADGQTWRETRNLEKVNERRTRVRFEYRIKGRFGGWSFKKYTKKTGWSVCSDRDDMGVTVE